MFDMRTDESRNTGEKGGEKEMIDLAMGIALIVFTGLCSLFVLTMIIAMIKDTWF